MPKAFEPNPKTVQLAKNPTSPIFDPYYPLGNRGVSGAWTNTTFTLADDTATGAGRPVTLAVPIGEGQLLATEELVVRAPDNSLLETQWSGLTTWRTDGSQLHGILTFETPSVGDNAGTYTLVKGTAATGTAISKADLAAWITANAAGRDAVASIVISGTTYSLALSDLLDGTVTPVKDYTHFSGPKCSSFCLGADLVDASDNPAPSGIQAHFEARAYGASGAVTRMYCVVSLENTGLDTELTSTVTDSTTVIVGEQALKNLATFTIHADCRYLSRGWAGGGPGLWCGLTPAYMQSTKLVPQYQTDDVITATLPTSMNEWNDGSNITNVNSGGGSQAELAPFARQTAAYFTVGSATYFNALRAEQDAFQQVVSNFNTGIWRPRSEATGHPMDIDSDGRMSLAGATVNTFPANRDGAPWATTDTAHYPSMGYSAYLITGEFTDLESCLFSGICHWLNEGADSQNAGLAGRAMDSMQIRAFGWTFREVANAGVICPDDHPLKATSDAAVVRAIEYTRSKARIGTTGLFETQRLMPSGYFDGNGIATWQHDYLTWAYGFAHERGYGTELDVDGWWTWRANAVLGRFGVSTEGEYCWAYAPASTLRIRDDSDSPFYQSWSELWSVNWSDITTCPTSGSDFAIGDGSSLAYGAQIGPALSTLVNTGVSGADAAWELYSARSKSWTFSDQPQWGVIPRETPSVAAPAYMDAMTLFETRVLTGGYAPADGNVTLADGIQDAPFPENSWYFLDSNKHMKAMIHSWNSGSIDSVDKRLLLHGGGHANGASNCIMAYRFNGDAGGLPLGWAALVGSSSDGSIIESVSYPDDVYPDGKPEAVHTYDGIDFDGVRKKLYRIGGAGWSPAGGGSQWKGHFDETAQQWVRSTFDGYPVDMNGFGVCLSVNDRTGLVGVSASGIGTFWIYDPDEDVAQSFPIGAVVPASGNYPVMVEDTNRERVFIFGDGFTRYMDMQWDSQITTGVSYTPTGDTECLNQNAIGTCFDSVGDCFWFWGRPSGQAGGDWGRLWKMDAETFACTEYAVTGTLPTYITTSGGYTFKRLMPLPEWGLIATVANFQEAPIILRVR